VPPVQVVLNWAEGEAGQVPPRLLSARPEDWTVADSWKSVVEPFWASDQGRKLLVHLHQRLATGAVVFPPQPLRALALTPLEAVRVVILGQDPYHGMGQAEGLAFSVAPGVRPPPSLRNIFKELHRNLGLAPPANGSLVRWARQGVLLLNTCLTVEEAAPASHAGQGWEVLTDCLIQRCEKEAGPKVFLLWGAHAQKKASLIDQKRHLVLSANHPSPLSAARPPVPFIGCGHFQEANRWLRGQGQTEIRW
jgi:uracil-DNA glycosylase